jgi:hypothetical protein
LLWSAKKGFAALALKMPKDDPATLIAIMELVLCNAYLKVPRGVCFLTSAALQKKRSRSVAGKI